MSEIDDLIYDGLDAAQELAEVLQRDETTIDDARTWIADTAETLAEIASEMKGNEK